MGSEADGLNLAEIRANALGLLRGGQPRSIRKRGYYRALKRGESWAELRYDPSTDPLLGFRGLSDWLPYPGADFYFGLDRTASTRFDRPPETLWSRIKSWFKVKI
jgi:hypothetical protein